MGETIQVQTEGGSFGAYLAKPASGQGPGIVVIQEIFGVNQVVRDLADQFAAEGYVVLAPDLFWRIEPGVDITDQSQAEWDKAFDLFGKFNADLGVKDIQATINALRAQPGVAGRKVGAVGHCLGGLLAYLTATRTDIDASVSYYGVNIASMLDEASKISKPILFHIAEKDGFVPPDAQKQVTDALGPNPHATLLTYAGRDHAFARPGGQHFHADAARSANAATAAFFKAHLG